MTGQYWTPSNAICESCHGGELLLRTVEFSDGALFKVCFRCAEGARLLGLAVLA